MNVRELRVDAALAGQRLYRALAALTPELGLRGRRRLAARGAVLVNGRVGDAARRLRQGDVLALRDLEDGAGTTPCSADMPRLLSRQGDYCFLYKPAGLHSAALAGDNSPSLEALLPALLPEEGEGRAPRLMQRLDYGTSGIVCAALGAKAAQAFRVAERAGRCEKRYLALLRGTLAGPSTVRLALDTADRRQSRVLADTDDMLRWTEFLPLHAWDGAAATGLLAGLILDPAHGGSASSEGGGDDSGGLTLAACRIRCGARHQIRAHAAALGHPLWGDGLYGRSDQPGPAGTGFFLHHGALLLPGAACVQPPAWPLPDAQAGAVRKWLESPAQCGILRRGHRDSPDPHQP